MAANHYIGSVQHTAVAQWAANTAYVSTSNGGRGDYVRQLAAPAAGSERVFRCTTSGTSHATTEPVWVLTALNATTPTDGTVTWTECTGREAEQATNAWKAPHARLRNAYVATWGAAGDMFVVANNHAATEAAALTLTNPGTLAAPCQIVVVNPATAGVPPIDGNLTTGATETTTGNSFGTVLGCFLSDGITYSFGTGAVSTNNVLGGAAQSDMIFRNGAISAPGTGTVTLLLGSTNNSIGTRIVFEKEFKWNPGSAASTLLPQTGGDFIWKDTATAVGGVAPTNLFGASINGAGTVLCDGVDFSALSGKTLVAATSKFGVYDFKDCKLPASLTRLGASSASAAVRVRVIRSASGGTAYTLESHDTKGAQTTEIIIFRTGGKTINGTPVAMKLKATANASWQSPFESTRIIANNTTTAANVTLTVYGIWAGGAIPTNAELWLEIGYLGAATPILTFDNSTRKSNILAAAATVAVTDASTWGGSTTKFKWVVTLSSPQPALAGEMYVVVKGCTTNDTYIDPKVYLS